MFSTLDMEAVIRMFVRIKQVLWLVDRKFITSYERVKVLYFCKLLYFLNKSWWLLNILIKHRRCWNFSSMFDFHNFFARLSNILLFLVIYIFAHSRLMPWLWIISIDEPSAITCSKLTIEVLEQVVKYLQS